MCEARSHLMEGIRDLRQRCGVHDGTAFGVVARPESSQQQLLCQRPCPSPPHRQNSRHACRAVMGALDRQHVQQNLHHGGTGHRGDSRRPRSRRRLERSWREPLAAWVGLQQQWQLDLTLPA